MPKTDPLRLAQFSRAAEEASRAITLLRTVGPENPDFTAPALRMLRTSLITMERIENETHKA